MTRRSPLSRGDVGAGAPGPARDWGALRPCRARPHERRARPGEEPLISVLVPRFGWAWVDRWAGRLGLGARRVHLDEPGSLVWELADGQHTVREIGRRLEERFGERVRPVDKRLPELLRRMARAELVELEA